jgi:hypothetical protein
LSVAAVKLAPGTGTLFNNAREGRVIARIRNELKRSGVNDGWKI